jgi:hypothetical protein
LLVTPGAVFRSPPAKDLLCCAPLLCVLFVAIWLSFPIYDDGYYLLLAREALPATLAEAHPDRPLMGWFYAALAAAVRDSAAALAAISTLFWAVLGLQTAMLWRRLHPHARQWSPLAACLVVAPLAVETQLGSVMLLGPALLPVTFALGALLAADSHLRGHGGRLWRWAAACGALALALLLSEYPWALLLGVAPLAWRRRSCWRPERIPTAAAAMAATGVAAGGLFFATRSVDGIRVDMNAAFAWRSLFERGGDLPWNLLRGFYRSAAGAYFEALGAVRPTWLHSRWSMVAVTFGILFAAWVVWVCRPRTSGSPKPVTGVGPAALAAAAGLALALAPVVVMARQTAGTGFTTRFLIPALPVAVVFTLTFCSLILNPRYWTVAAALLGLAAGHSLVLDAKDAVKYARAADQLGRRLVAMAAKDRQSGLILGAVRFDHSHRWAPGSPYMVTAQVARSLATRQARRLLLYNAAVPLPPLPPRSDCGRIEGLVPWEQRRIRREGPVDQFLWIEETPTGELHWSPYCASEAALSGQFTAAHGNGPQRAESSGKE